MEHHNLDAFPIPKDEKPLYINEPWLIDRSLEWIMQERVSADPLPDDDNIRVYLPMDISKASILRRLDWVIMHYGEVSFWNNESDFDCDVRNLISQIEIYDQIWFVRHMPKHGRHSAEAIELVREFIEKLKEIPEGDGEMFPYNTIEELQKEYIDQS
ncbi:MAG: hypothetical protein ILA24_03930 [Ruminococcus sp.]|nr:hypothetical protein [Ruminococcus sp.]